MQEMPQAKGNLSGKPPANEATLVVNQPIGDDPVSRMLYRMNAQRKRNNAYVNEEQVDPESGLPGGESKLHRMCSPLKKIKVSNAAYSIAQRPGMPAYFGSIR
jgi:hypothetical protein